MQRNRWLIALCAVLINLSIWAVYAYSVFKKPLMAQFGWEDTAVAMVFSIAIFFLGLSAAFAGRFVKKYGPKKMWILAGILYWIGIIWSWLAVHFWSLYMLYMFYWVIWWIWLWIAYLAPLPTLLKWFPDRKWLASGMAIMGFGFAALIVSPIMKYLIWSVGISEMFYILGAIYLLVIVWASLYMADPKEWRLPVWFDLSKLNKKSMQCIEEVPANKVLRKPRFYILWLMFFINILWGITIISNASPLAQDMAGMSVIAATLMVGIMGAFNGWWRLIRAALSDYMGRLPVYMTFFIVQLVLFLLLPHISNPVLFQVIIFVVMTCYGGGFSCMPAFITQLFGDKSVWQVRWFILTAWATAWLVGPILSSYLKKLTNSYTSVLTIYAGLFGIALILSVILWISMRRQSRAIIK